MLGNTNFKWERVFIIVDMDGVGKKMMRWLKKGGCVATICNSLSPPLEDFV